MASNVRALSAKPVRVPKTAELVAGHLRRRIVRGELNEGDALPPEAELMEQFGISRPTLREAFRVLESESLITVRRGARGGARVHLPDLSVAGRYSGLLLQVQGATLDDVFGARIVIEPAAARMVAEQHRRDVIERLLAAIDAEEEEVENPAGFAEASAMFHAQLVAESGNKTLALLAGTLTEVIVASTEHAVAHSKRDESQVTANLRAVRAHRKLVGLLEKGDADEAETFWTRHMGVVRQRFLDNYGATTLVELLT